MRGTEALPELTVERVRFLRKREPVERDMHLEILTLVARIDAVKRLTIRFGHVLAVENLGGRTGQLGKCGGDLRPGFEAGRRDPGLRQVEA
jgi:hypothetical protein